MGDFLRSIMKWILLVLAVVFVVWLVIHLANKNEAKKEKPKEVTIKEERSTTIEDPIPNSTEKTEEPQLLVIDAVDTGTTRGMTVWIGALILSSGAIYIVKTKKCTE